MNKKEKLKILTLYLHKRRKSMKEKVLALMLALINTESTLCTLINMQINRLRVDPRLLLSSQITKSVTPKSRNNKHLFWESKVPKMSEYQFKQNFRVTKQSFNKICQKTEDMESQEDSTESCIPHRKQVAIALYALGTWVKYNTVAQLFNVECIIVTEIVKRICIILCDTFNKYISTYPPTTNEIKRIVSGFERDGFPQCFGAVGTCHIKIEPRIEETVDYYSYKGFPSIILLASCDHSSKFTYVSIGSHGSNTNLNVFENSSLSRFHKNSRLFVNNGKNLNNFDVPVILIGDASFHLSNFMMIPYPPKAKQPTKEKIFNYRLNKSQQVVKDAFSQLKTRFRKIGGGLEATPESYNIIVKACCLLHNFLKTEQDDLTELYTTEYEDSDIQKPANETIFSGDNIAAKAIRNAIALSFRFNGVSDSEDSNELAFTMRGNENEDVGSVDESGSHFVKDEFELDSS